MLQGNDQLTKQENIQIFTLYKDSLVAYNEMIIMK